MVIRQFRREFPREKYASLIIPLLILFTVTAYANFPTVEKFLRRSRDFNRSRRSSTSRKSDSKIFINTLNTQTCRFRLEGFQIFFLFFRVVFIQMEIISALLFQLMSFDIFKRHFRDFKSSNNYESWLSHWFILINIV